MPPLRQILEPVLHELPAGARGKHRLAFGGVAILLFLLAFGAPMLASRAIMARQRARKENAIVRAIEAVKGGGESEARELSKRAIHTTLEQRMEGNARLALAPDYTELAAALLKRGWAPEARAAAFKAIRHYHRSPQALEYLDPWRVIQGSYESGEFGRFLDAFEIIGSHSVGSNREYFESRSGDAALRQQLAKYAELREKFYNLTPAHLAARLRKYPIASEVPEIRSAVARIRIKTHLATQDTATAIAEADALMEAFPGDLEVRAIHAEAHEGTGTEKFVARLAKDPVLRVVDFSKARAVATEFHPAQKAFPLPDGGINLRKSGAVRLGFKTDRAAKQVHLLAQGSEFLDVFPILIVSVDDQEPFPIYIDSRSPDLFPVDLALELGSHEITFHFVNDFDWALAERKFAREVRLFRLILE